MVEEEIEREGRRRGKGIEDGVHSSRPIKDFNPKG